MKNNKHEKQQNERSVQKNSFEKNKQNKKFNQ
jgi:hypothetical protein